MVAASSHGIGLIFLTDFLLGRPDAELPVARLQGLPSQK